MDLWLQTALLLAIAFGHQPLAVVYSCPYLAALLA
jgi:hypothetical protein